MENDFIQIKNLIKHYESGGESVYALGGVTFSIKLGDFSAIMGPSGSGKSTLLTHLGGLSRPTSGEVIIDGFDIFSLSNKSLSSFRREYIGFVFQSFQLIPFLTVAENVNVPLLTKKLSDLEQTELVDKALTQVGLIDKRKRLIQNLSGGEQQRVAVARALVNDPPIILADEPTGNLDTKTGNQIINVFKELNEIGKTVIIVTHNEEYGEIVDYTIELKDGKLFRSNSEILEEITA